MRDRLRWVARLSADASLVVLAAGLLILGIGTLVVGDFYALRLPWSGWGIDLTVAGVALTAITLGARVIVEPLGWWRLLAVPPALVTACIWMLLLVFGLGAGGACCKQPANPGVGTLLYSSPETAAWLLISTLLIGLPLLTSRLRHRGSGPPAASTTALPDPATLSRSP